MPASPPLPLPLPLPTSTQPPLQVGASVAALVTQSASRVRLFTGSLPPSSLVLLSSLSVQVGTALAKSLFDILDPTSAAFVTKLLAALLLLAIWRPRLHRHGWSDYGLIMLLGLSIAGMSLAFYGAVARIPMGVASTIEFIGPLGVAIAGSRRWIDGLWVTMALAGIVLLTPINNAALDPTGVTLAFVSGGCWAAFILVSGPAGRAFTGGTGLALGMAIASAALLPIGVAHSGLNLLQPQVLVVGLVVACLGTLVPYSLEFRALRSLPPRVFGVLISIEPAIAALVGLVLLGEELQSRSILAILLVTGASIGVTLSGRSANR